MKLPGELDEWQKKSIASLLEVDIPIFMYPCKGREKNIDRCRIRGNSTFSDRALGRFVYLYSIHRNIVFKEIAVETE